jgi:hypothetical protein
LQEIKRINVISEINPEIWVRQIDSMNFSKFGNIVFTLVPVYADVYVFYGTSKKYLLLNQKATCIYFIVEPRNLKSHSILFLKQFDAIFGSIPLKLQNKPNYFTIQPGLPWHIGIDFNDVTGKVNLNFQDLNNAKMPTIESVSVITSNKIISKEHYRRVKFVEELSRIMGSRLKVYGRGSKPVSDKNEVLSNYRYHLALENNSQNDYWSEKLADPIIALNKVFYFGAPNIEKYFPEQAVKLIDINNPLETAKMLISAIENSTWQKDLEAIQQAKLKILGEYNYVNFISDLNFDTTVKKRRRIYGDFRIKPTRLIKKLRWKITSHFYFSYLKNTRK